MSKRVLNYENFDLQKVKLTKEGINVEYYEKGGTFDKHTVEAVGLPHPDLIGAFESLQLYMAMRLGLLKGWDFAREQLKKKPESLQEAINGYEEELSRCNVSGIVFVEQEQLKGIKITGSLKCEYGAVGLATPNITFSSDKLGFEKDVEDLCEVAKKETFLYLFKNKKAQQDLVTQAEEAEAEAKEEEFKLNGEE